MDRNLLDTIKHLSDIPLWKRKQLDKTTPLLDIESCYIIT